MNSDDARRRAWQRLVDNDADAWNELVDNVYAFARRWLSIWNMDVLEAEDVSHETMIELMNDLGDPLVVFERPLRAWARGIAWNKLRRVRYEARKRAATPIDDERTRAERPRPTAEDISAALVKLHEDLRVPLGLWHWLYDARHIQQKSLAEIARERGENEKTLRGQWFRKVQPVIDEHRKNIEREDSLLAKILDEWRTEQ